MATKSDKQVKNDSLASFSLNFTEEQKKARKVCHDNIVTVLTGKPGTSKSTICASVALEYFMSKSTNPSFSYSPKHELNAGKVKKIIITRPAIEAGEKLGFLPGGMGDKLLPYMAPILYVMDKLVGGEKSMTQEMFEKGTLEVLPLQFMRGRTFENCIVIADESQNADLEQFKLLSSRLGYNAKLLITSDWRQIDLVNRNKSASMWIDKIMHLDNVGQFELTENFRHPLAVQIMDVLMETTK
jgi:phosphate starvation-inducible protein PhoH